jgi:hypothetical protein
LLKPRTKITDKSHRGGHGLGGGKIKYVHIRKSGRRHNRNTYERLKRNGKGFLTHPGGNIDG